MTNLEGCQIPCLPRLADGLADVGPQPFTKRIKRLLAKVWNYSVKKTMKKVSYAFRPWLARSTIKQSVEELAMTKGTVGSLKAGDTVRVRSLEEIQATLDPWKELKGCAFLEYMREYCGTTQRVLQSMERFLDERDYKVKKVKEKPLELLNTIRQTFPFVPC